MRLDNLIDELIGALKGDERFDDISVWRAYPNRLKETRLSKVNIAVGFSSIDVSPSEIDGNSLAGEVSVLFNIFVPLSMDDRCFCEILNNICNALSYKSIVRIAVDKMRVNANVQAYELGVAISFRDEISLGGNGDG